MAAYYAAFFVRLLLLIYIQEQSHVLRKSGGFGEFFLILQ
jgi:hypothetical protein